MREQDLTDAEVDELTERFDLTVPSIRRRILARILCQRETLLRALKGAVTLADRCHDHWDADEDSKVGKILAAMAGHLKRYNAEATAMHEAIAEVEDTP